MMTSLVDRVVRRNLYIYRFLAEFDRRGLEAIRDPRVRERVRRSLARIQG